MTGVIGAAVVWARHRRCHPLLVWDFGRCEPALAQFWRH